MEGKRYRAGLGHLLAPIALLCAGAAAAADKTATSPAATGPAPAIIVLDASRSMWTRLGGQAKVPIARTAIGQALDDYKAGVAFGLVAFGHKGSDTSCGDSELLAKAGELTSETTGKLQFGAGFKPRGAKPIASALVAAAKNGAPGATSLDIVLITDGPDSCKANVCATAKNLKQAAPNFRVHVIGIDAKAKQTLKPLRCVAESTGGKFLTAANANEFKKDLTTILDGVAKTAAAPAPVAQEDNVDESQPATVETAATPPLPTPAPARTASPPEPVTATAPATEAEVKPEAAKTAAAAAQGAPPGPAAPPAPATTEAKKASPATAPASAATKGDLVGPRVPGQTSVPKLAGVPTPGATSKPMAPGTGSGPAPPVPVTFKALLTETGPKVESGLVWRVFSAEAAPNGTRKLLSTHHEPNPTAALAPGEYLVNAAYGLSNLTKKVKVESGRTIVETFILNTGGLKLGAILANGQPLSKGSVHFDILSDEEDQFGHRRTVLGNAKAGVVIRLNAGAYHIVSLYGRANATVRADVTVEPGKITDATIKHAAAPVTFRLVQQAGGEALADTKWSVLTPTGDVVKEVAGALPTLILAGGDYAVVANHNGESYTSKFSVATGEAKQIEVVMDEGPATAEALKAITEPPPPPPPSETPVATPGAPDTGMAFGGAESSTPRPPGVFSNPGALLRPRLP
jgi:von Willebrand factor type A domain